MANNLEKIIDLEALAGNETVSREHGMKVRAAIEEIWKTTKGMLIVDFSGRSVASPSFIDEAFAKLLLKYSLSEVKERLTFINMTDFDRGLLNELVRLRLRDRQMLETSEDGHPDETKTPQEGAV